MKYDATTFVEAEDGTRLFTGVRERAGGGAAPYTVVLSDGIGCDGFAWKYIQPRMAEHARVVHWHYRGHGRSALPRDRQRIDIVDHARDLVSVLDHYEIEHAVVLGHSMGTQIALEAYRAARARIAGLGLFCGSYGRITQTFHGSDVLERVLPTIISMVERYGPLVRGLWGRIPSGIAFRIARLSGEVDGVSLREEDFRWYMDHVAAMDPELFFAILKLAGAHSAEDLLPTIDVPAIVVAAERDTFTPTALAQHMAETIPGAEYLLLRGASHAAPVEQPNLICERLDHFLGERVSPALAAR